MVVIVSEVGLLSSVTHSTSDFLQQISSSITKPTIGSEESLPLMRSEWLFPFPPGPW